MPNTFDAVVKSLVTKRADDWVRFLDLPARAPAEVIPADLSVVSAAADALIRVGNVVLHIEFQTGPDEELAERVLLYNVLARKQTGLPVHSVVFLLRPNTGRGTDRVEYAVDSARGGLSFRFEVLRAWERPVEEFLTGPLALVPLAMVAQPPAGRTRAAMLPDVIRRIDDRVRAEAPGERSNMTLAAFLLGGLRLPDEQLEAIYLGVPGMEDNAAIRVIEKFAEIRTTRRHIAMLAEERFGPPTPDQVEHLNRVEKLDRLNRLLRRTLRVDSWDALLRGR